MTIILIKNAMVHSITTPSRVCDVLIENGKIKDISTKINKTGEINEVDATGKHLLPGFIDPHTHLGMYNEGMGPEGSDTNEVTNPIMPHIRALDSVYIKDLGFKDAVKYGVTTAQVMPGSMNVIGGLSSVIKTYGTSMDDMIIKEVSGLKIALGENPKKTHGITRMGLMGMLREIFIEAQQCDDENNMKLRPIKGALKKEYPIRIHAHRSDDILSAIRFAKEFDLDLCIEHCTEGHLVAEHLKNFKGSIALGPTMTRRSKSELKNKSWEVYPVLHSHGIDFAIMTDHPYIPIQYLTQCAALSVREGLDKEVALRGITINAAKHLGVSDRIGSIEKGKDADLVLWTKHPFDYESIPLWTMIDGKIIFER